MMLTEELFGDGRVLLPVISWLLTYLLHSTLFLAAAWLAAKWLIGDRPRLEDALWKTALIGGLLTASLQTATPWRSGAVQWTLAPATTDHDLVLGVAALPETGVALATDAAGRTSEQVARLPEAQQVTRVAPWILLAWLLGGTVSVLALGRQGRALQRRLKDRSEVTEGPIRAMVDELCREIGVAREVRLSATDRITVPIALGLLRPEICLPRRSLDSLSADEQRSLLAHELAHLARRDPAWYLTSASIAGLCFFQPLNRLAGRRLRRLSEVLCDDWAVASTGSAASLARCLTEVAGWAIERPRFFPSPGIAGDVTELGRRIQRLVDGRSGRGARLPRGMLLAALAAWALVGTIAPSWTAEPSSSPEGSEGQAPLPMIASGELPGDPEPVPTTPVPLDLEDSQPAADPAEEAFAVPALAEGSAEIQELADADAPTGQEPTREAKDPPVREDASEQTSSAPEPGASEPATSEPAASEPYGEPALGGPPEASDRDDPVPAQEASPDLSASAPEPTTPTLSQPTLPADQPRAAAVEPGEGNFTPPVVEVRPVPRFPQMAIRLNKWQGSVTLQLKIDETGRVIDAQPVGERSGFGFEREAIRAVRNSKYRPAQRDGVPVATEVTVEIRFQRR